MTQISSTFSATRLTPRTANYVTALIREGDNFDYCRWLEQVRVEETPARELRKAKTEQIVSEEIGAAVGTCRGRETSPNVRPFNRRVPIPIGITHSRRKALHSSSGTRIKWRFQKIRDAWDKFQANRARDAVRHSSRALISRFFSWSLAQNWWQFASKMTYLRVVLIILAAWRG